jgi:23S rRNA (adenine2503-C2)-methyltransferase
MSLDASSTLGRSAESVHPLARELGEWAEVLGQKGEKPFRARQVFRWLHERGELDPERMTDLSLGLRRMLGEGGSLEPGQLASSKTATDGTRKLLVDFAHGAKVECVLIPMTAEATDADASAAALDEDEATVPIQKKRITLCISTQFGCAMGCVFCASGQAGLFRGLGAAEVLYQVLLARRCLLPDEELRNLVLMGMGEPLHHYEETARALRLLTAPEARGMSPRRITVSTVGLVPGIRRLGEDFGGKVGLAVSLHAPNDEVRSRIIPMNRRYPIAELMAALEAYPLPARRRITIEYTLIGGVNDSLAQADELARLLRKLRVKVNLIPLNTTKASDLRPPTPEAILRFRERLAQNGYSCFVRTRRGDDVDAACGQLAMQAIDPTRLVRRPSS